MPSPWQFNGEAMPDIWDKCLLINVQPGRTGIYMCSYMGDTLMRSYGADLSGTFIVRQARRHLGTILHEKVKVAVSERQPVEDMGIFINQHGRLARYRACFLPLSQDRKQVSHVVVGIGCRCY